MVIRKDGSQNLRWDADKISFGKEFNQKYILPLDSNYLNQLFNVDNEDTD